MNDIICKEVIISSLRSIGKGTEEDPCRRLVEVFEKDGKHIAIWDEFSPKVYTKEDMISFGQWVRNRYVPNKEYDFEKEFDEWIRLYKKL